MTPSLHRLSTWIFSGEPLTRHEDVEGNVGPVVGGPVGDIHLECRAGHLGIRVEGDVLDGERDSLVEMRTKIPGAGVVTKSTMVDGADIRRCSWNFPKLVK